MTIAMMNIGQTHAHPFRHFDRSPSKENYCEANIFGHDFLGRGDHRPSSAGGRTSDKET
jgi:hypothetical protein